MNIEYMVKLNKSISSDIKTKNENLPKTPRTPKGYLSPKIINKWDNLLLNNDLTQQNNKYFNYIDSLNNNDLPKTPRTPKGHLSPKIIYKWNISFFN